MRGVRRITHDISDISPASFILQTELCNLLLSILGRFLEHKTLQLYGKKKMFDVLLSKRPSHIKRNASVMAHCLPSFELFTSQFNLTANIHVIVEKDDNVTSCHPTAHGDKWRFLFEVSVFLSIFPDKRSFFFLLFWSYFSSAALVSQIPLVQKHWGKYVTNIQIPSLVFSFFI